MGRQGPGTTSSSTPSGREDLMDGGATAARQVGSHSVFYKVMHTRVANIQSGAEDRRRSARRHTRSKDNFFNRNQLEQARKWLVTYLETAMNKPSRKLRMDIGKYPKATIITDASPKGLGAILLRDAEELGFTLEHCRNSQC